MKKVLLLGGLGFFGSSIKNFLLKKKKYQVFSQTRDKIRGKNIISRNIKNINFSKYDYVINLNAATDVLRCEKDLDYNYLGNIDSIKTLVLTIKKNKKKPFLVHISTDSVYSNKSKNIEKITSPKNKYGLYKLLGESYAKQVNSIILRTNFFGRTQSSKKISYTDWILKNIKSNKKIILNEKVYFSPLHTSKVCQAILLAMKKKYIGVYNLGSSGRISKKNFIIKFLKSLKFKRKVILNLLNTNKNYKLKTINLDMTSENFSNKFKWKTPNINSQISLAQKEYEKNI
jgi:dTDP-4-dehydrorhamnose reductase